MPPNALPVLVVLEPGAGRHACLDVGRERAAAAGLPLVLLACGPGEDLPPAWTGRAAPSEYAAVVSRRRTERLEALAAPLRQLGLPVTAIDACGSDAAASLREQLEQVVPALVVKDSRSDAFSRWHRLTDQVLLQQRRYPVLLVEATLDGQAVPGGQRHIPAADIAADSAAETAVPATVSAVPASCAPAEPGTRRASSP